MRSECIATQIDNTMACYVACFHVENNILFQAEDLYEKLKEDLENFKNNSDSAEQKKRNPVSRAFSATVSNLSYQRAL